MESSPGCDSSCGSLRLAELLHNIALDVAISLSPHRYVHCYICVARRVYIISHFFKVTSDYYQNIYIYWRLY